MVYVNKFNDNGMIQPHVSCIHNKTYTSMNQNEMIDNKDGVDDTTNIDVNHSSYPVVAPIKICEFNDCDKLSSSFIYHTQKW